MPKILIDIYKAGVPNSGLGQFSMQIHNAFIKEHTNDYDLTFLAPRNFDDKRTGADYKSVSLQKRILPSLNKKYDLWHSLHQFPSHHPPKDTIQLLTVHDLNFLREKKEQKAEKYLRRLQKNIDRADHINTISHFTKKELETHLSLKGKKISVIHNGVSLIQPKEDLKPTLQLKGPFFFSIGIFSAKKNFEVLIPLMKFFPDHQLIIAGKKDTHYGRSIEQKIADEGLSEQVLLPGEVEEEEKSWLFHNCEAFLFPSFAEGFGMPVIEAMLSGKPVFLNKTSSLPEIGGPHAFYWDEMEVESMKQALIENLRTFKQDEHNLSLALRKHATKFTWDKCVKEYLQLYKSILRKV